MIRKRLFDVLHILTWRPLRKLAQHRAWVGFQQCFLGEELINFVVDLFVDLLDRLLGKFNLAT